MKNKLSCSRHFFLQSPFWQFWLRKISDGFAHTLHYFLQCISFQAFFISLLRMFSITVWIRVSASRCLKITEKVSFNIASIQHCERSELHLHSEWTKVNYKCQKWSILASFWKPEACGQTALPDNSLFNKTKIGGKWQNSKIQMRHFE